MITGGENLVLFPPAFSNDCKKLLVCTGNTVSVFSTSTGIKITELEGHVARVTSVIVVPVAAPASKLMCYCWTASLDGTICYWDFSLPELIKKVEVQLPIHSMVIPYSSSPPVEATENQFNCYAFVSVEDDRHTYLHGQIRIVNLTKSNVVGGLLAETQNPETIAVSNSGEFFGIRNGRKLHIFKVPAKDFKSHDIKKIKLHHTKDLTVLAFHPTERVIAGGDMSGRILIWRGFGRRRFAQKEQPIKGRKLRNEEERPGVRDDDDADSCSTWHWHPNGVKCLCFSSDGAYLFSGGREGVVVIWQLETRKKKFLPRMGSAILYLTKSPDPSLSSISCADNQIHLLKSHMEILKSISGIKPPCSLPEIYGGSCSNYIFDRTAGLLALRANTYSIQFYSLFDNRSVSQVQVYERNYHPDDEIMVAVTLVALSIDGSMMSTAEVKLPEQGIGGSFSLKFWNSGSRHGMYALSTVIYEPHSDAGISALAFRPTHSMVVSSSYGGDFKIWVRSYDIQKKDQLIKKSGWRCQSVGSYKKRPMTAAAFSADGSVLAVAAESVITLWNPDKNVLITVIGETLTPISTLSFIGKSEYLVSISRGSKAQLSVWNLSKLSISWSYKLLVEAVACTPDSSHFAVLGLVPESSKSSAPNGINLQDQDGLILLFNAEDPIPVSTWSVKKAKGGGIGFVQSNPSVHNEKAAEGEAPSVMLAYVNGDHEYVIFNPYGREEHQLNTNHRETHAAPEETEAFGYTHIYGKLPEYDVRKDLTPVLFLPSDRPWETIFSGSSHVLPPLTNLCSAFLASLLEKRPTVQQ